MKVAFITGTAGGQGAAAQKLFEERGWRVVGCDIVDGVDLTDPDQAREWIDASVASAGGIDVLYNNASAPRVGPWEQLTYEDWQFTLRNELDLIYTVTKAGLRRLREHTAGWNRLASAIAAALNSAPDEV